MMPLHVFDCYIESGPLHYLNTQIPWAITTHKVSWFFEPLLAQHFFSKILWWWAFLEGYTRVLGVCPRPMLTFMSRSTILTTDLFLYLTTLPLWRNDLSKFNRWFQNQLTMANHWKQLKKDPFSTSRAFSSSNIYAFQFSSTFWMGDVVYQLYTLSMVLDKSLYCCRPTGIYTVVKDPLPNLM